jgi:DUF971 family protein
VSAVAERSAWPTELRLKKAARTLTVSFDDGANFTLPAELLRVYSPSAEVKGHGGVGGTLVHGKRSVAIASLDAVGNYAVRIAFDDGHKTGLYTWAYLRELGETQAAKWAAYEARLAEAGLSRG